MGHDFSSKHWKVNGKASPTEKQSKRPRKHCVKSQMFSGFLVEQHQAVGKCEIAVLKITGYSTAVGIINLLRPLGFVASRPSLGRRDKDREFPALFANSAD